jgi:hypothetical protein
MSPRLSLALAALLGAAPALSAGCGAGRRAGKFLAPRSWVTPAHPVGELAEVRYDQGWRGFSPTLYEPSLLEVGGATFHQATPLTSRGWLEVSPSVEGAEVSVWVRNTGLVRQDFQPVRTLSGDLVGQLPTELRFLPRALHEPLRLEVSQLENPYNAYHMDDGDLLLVEISAPDHPTERYLFSHRELGLKTKVSAGVLLAPPVSFLPDQPDSTQPILGATLALGWRSPSPNQALQWFGSHFAVVWTVGIGSTTLETLQDSEQEDLQDQASAYFNAALAGVGVELYDFVSIQALANLSALTRDITETPSAIAVGFDALRFGAFFRDAGARLLRDNPIDPPPEDL